MDCQASEFLGKLGYDQGKSLSSDDVRATVVRCLLALLLQGLIVRLVALVVLLVHHRGAALYHSNLL